jgi:hypothetical protein
MDWAKWITEPTAGGLGGLIGATVGTYFKNYWGEKGKNLATYSDIKFLLAQERGKAYEQEKGKRLATHEDIQNVLKEVKAVTRETETIKAQISSDLWLRQTVWNHKREAYGNIVKCSHALEDKLNTLRSTRLVLQHGQLNGLPESHLQMLRSEVQKSTAEYIETQRQYIDALQEAEMFLNGPVTLFLSDFISHEWLGDVMKENSDPAKSLQLIIALRAWIGKLIAFAKVDLGVTATPAASDIS